MNKKSVNKPTKPVTRDKPRRVRAATLLNAAATLFAAALVVVTDWPKLPPSQGD